MNEISMFWPIQQCILFIFSSYYIILPSLTFAPKYGKVSLELYPYNNNLHNLEILKLT